MCGNVRSPQFGGNGGNVFADDLTEVCALVQINIRSGAEVDAIQGVWENPLGARVTGPRHGGTGGTLQTIRLDKGEFITRVEGRAGNRIDQLTFITNTGKTFGPFGGGGGREFPPIDNLHVTGFFGRAGSRLDAIGFFVPGPDNP